MRGVDVIRGSEIKPPARHTVRMCHVRVVGKVELKVGTRTMVTEEMRFM